MKKEIVLVSALFACLLLSSTALATNQCFSTPYISQCLIELVKKNPTTWQRVYEYFAGRDITPFGQLYVNSFDQVNLYARNLKPNKDYTLIYYGYQDKNDIWAWATCISTVKSSPSSCPWYNPNCGNLFIKTRWEHTSFYNDGIAQKFWLVESQDVDCPTHKMTAWHPGNILFEQLTI